MWKLRSRTEAAVQRVEARDEQRSELIDGIAIAAEAGFAEAMAPEARHDVQPRHGH